MRATRQNTKSYSELIADVLLGKQIDKLYSVLVPFIVSIIRRNSFHLIGTDTNELAHDIFVKTYYRLEKYNTSKPLFPWVHTIVKNHLIDLYRKQKTEKCGSLDLLLENNSSEFFDMNLDMKNSPEHLLIRKENLLKLSVVLDQLNEKDKRLIIGFYLEEKSLKELCIEHNLASQNAVSIRLFRAKITLRKLYQSGKDFPTINC